MAPAHDTGVFTTVRQLLNIFTAYMGCCEEFDPKCSGDELLMVTGFVNDAAAENNGDKTFAAESRKAKVEAVDATEKQVRKKAVMADDSLER